MKEVSKNIESAVEHDEVDRGSSDPTSLDTLAETINVTVSVPQSLEIELVNSSVLHDYEIWGLISAILSNAVIGIFVATMQSGWSFPLVFPGVVFLVLFIITFIVTLHKRKQLKRKAKSIPFVPK